MNTRPIRHTWIVATLVALAVLGGPSVGHAVFVVSPGYDLFQTVTPTTSFLGIPLMGVPLSTFDFGGTIGVQNVGNTDTIVQRLGTATLANPTVPIVLQAIQLQSVGPVSLVPFGGTGTGVIFVTLHGAQAQGSLTVHFTDDLHGTFDSVLPEVFDIHVGSLTGTVIFTGTHPGGLISFANPWDRVPVIPLPPFPPPPLVPAIHAVIISNALINGVNFNLNGPSPPNPNQDIFAKLVISETPEPGSLVLLGLGIIGVGVPVWWRRGRSA